MRAALFIVLFFNFSSMGQAEKPYKYSCIDRKTNAEHIVTVIPGYKLVNTINTGHSFDYSLDYINQNIPFYIGCLLVSIGIYLIYGLIRLKVTCRICLLVHFLNVIILMIQII